LKLLSTKRKIQKRDYLTGRDGTHCLYGGEELDLEHCIIEHLNGDPTCNEDWNLALSCQKHNIEKLDNYDYQIIAKEKIKQNQSMVYAPRIEDKNENVSTEVEINKSNREITLQYLTERTIDGKTIGYKDTLDSITYLCQRMTGHGSQKCIRDYISALCSSIAPFMIVKDENKNKVIQRRAGN